MWELRYAVLLSSLRASNGLDGNASGPTVPALKLSRISFHFYFSPSLFLRVLVLQRQRKKKGSLPSGGSCACYTYRDEASRQQLTVQVWVIHTVMRFSDHHEISYLSPHGAQK